jgi:hypothetical protein
MIPARDDSIVLLSKIDGNMIISRPSSARPLSGILRAKPRTNFSTKLAPRSMAYCLRWSIQISSPCKRVA